MIKLKHILLMLIAIMLLAVVGCGSDSDSDSSTADGYRVLADGSWEIFDKKGLNAFRDAVNAGNVAISAKLTDNITLDNKTNNTSWVPIGNDNNKYAGIFDGNGYTISDLYLSGLTNLNQGLFGETASGSVIKNLGVKDIEIQCTVGRTVGGIVGKSLSLIVASYVDNITITNSGSPNSGYAGGIAGGNQGKVNATVVDGVTIDNFEKIGGVISQNLQGGTLSTSYFVSTTITEGVGNATSNSPVASITPTETTALNTALNLHDFEYVLSNGEISLTKKATQPTLNGVTIENGVYVVSSEEGLKNIRELIAVGNYNISIKLASDITLASEWTPIAQFNGTFDGNNKTISDLTITTGEQVGLFGEIQSKGVVKNLKINAINLTARAEAGAVVGINYGTIENVGVTGGTITATFDSGRVGGIAGMNDGFIHSTYSENITINSTNITSPDEIHAGGLVGFNSDGTLSASYVNGLTIDIDPTLKVYAGGVTGENTGSVIANYANITSIANTNTNSGSRIGGVVGYGGVTPLYTNYFISDQINVGVTGQSFTEANVKKVPAITVDEIAVLNNKLALSNYEYVLDGGKAVVRLKATKPTLNGVTISNAGTYIINSEQGLSTVRDYINSVDKRINVTLAGNIALTAPTKPIEMYTGTFDGGGHTISSMNITSDASVVGFIGMLKGTVKNLTITGATINSTLENNFVIVGIIGYNEGTVTKITSTNNRITVQSANSIVGGVVGANDGSLTGSIYRGNTITAPDGASVGEETGPIF